MDVSVSTIFSAVLPMLLMAVLGASLISASVVLRAWRRRARLHRV